MVSRTDAAAARPRLAALLVVAVFAAGGVPAASAHPRAAAAEPSDSASASRWIWPLAGFRVVESYVAPAGPYGPGHRGIDLLPLAADGVRAPAAGTVAFAGAVAGRGILTIDHGDGYVTTLEPVDTALTAGTRVHRGEDVAAVALGGHTPPGGLHFGVRLNGEYVNPLTLLGGVPRAVLLPCC